MRSHFTLLVASRDTAFAHPFEQLGAIARFIPDTLLSATLRLGNASPLAAQAIAISSQNNEFDNDGFLRALAVANEVRGLPDTATMQNGIRWKKVPITIVVPSDEMVDRTRGEPWLRSIAVCPASRGWANVYEIIERQVQDFGHRLIDELRSVGWQIREENGRYFRDRAPSLKRRGGVIPDLETELYDGRRDLLFGKRTLRDRLPLRIVHTDPEATQVDYETFRRIINERASEATYQRFLNERAHILNSAPFELLPRPTLWDPDANEARYPDYSMRRWDFEDDELRLVDLKTPYADLLAHARKELKFASEISTGIAQMRGYQRIADDPRVRGYRETVFPDGGVLGPSLLIAGRKGSANAKAFELERDFYKHAVEVRTYDELLEDFERRYLTDYSAPANPYGLIRLGYPPFDVEDPGYSFSESFGTEPTKRYGFETDSRNRRARRRH